MEDYPSSYVVDTSEMIRMYIIPPQVAVEALRAMFEKGSRLPLAECNKRLKKWTEE